MPTEKHAAFSGSLRRLLLWWLVPPVLIVVVVTSYVSYAIALRYASEAYDLGLFDEAKSLAEQIRFGADGKPVLELPRAAEEMIRSDPYDRIYYRVLGAGGETIAGRADLRAPAPPARIGEPVQYYDAIVGGAPVRACAYTLFDGDGAPIATVLLAETLIKRTKLSRSLLVTDFLLPLVALPLVMIAIVWLGVRRGLGPLRQLTAALARRGWNDLTPIGDHGTVSEVRPLTAAIDDLMRRLGIAVGAQKRFIEEAAHQLRTPLAGLAAQTERALAAKDMESVQSALEQLQVSSRRTTRLANQLLTLARAEPGTEPGLEFVDLDLAKLVRQICMDWVPVAAGKGIDLGFEGDADAVTIRGDELLLGEMLNNLIDNALRYGARSGGSVTVRLSRAERLELSVDDDGPGIPEAERERVFERFHRVPGSAPGGCGLGLAIVREIARVHGATVSAHPRDPDPGAVIRIVFGELLTSDKSGDRPASQGRTREA